MVVSTAQKGRMPARLIDYLLQARDPPEKARAEEPMEVGTPLYPLCLSGRYLVGVCRVFRHII